VLTLYFCFEDSPPVLRYWPSCPGIGELVALKEFGGFITPLRVYDVVWEGDDHATVSVYVSHAKVENPIVAKPHRSIEELLAGHQALK
jgi:hypothetical protein